MGRLRCAGRPRKQTGQVRKLRLGERENRCLANNVLRDMRSDVLRADIKPEAPITIHTLRKSFGQSHANAGTPARTDHRSTT